MSSFTAMMSSDELFGNPFPAFEGGFTPWDCQDPTFMFPNHDQTEPELVLSPLEQQEPVISNSGSDEPSLKRKNPDSGCDDPNQPVDSVIDERKRRRMLSNRESARKSRMRKQRHLENLRNQVNRLKIGNRELMNRLRFVTHHSQLLSSENDRLRSESAGLRQRLWDIRQVLVVRQLQQQIMASSAASAWPCNNFTSINDQETIPQSLIT